MEGYLDNMKKTTLAALFATLAMGVAQAVTLNWAETGTYENKGIIPGSGYRPVALVLAFDLVGSVSQETDLMKFGYWNGDAFLKMNEQGQFNYKAANWSPSGAPTLETGTHVVAINFTPSSGPNNAKVHLDIYVDGTLYASFDEGGNKTGLNVWLYANDAWDILGSAAYEGTLGKDQIDWLSANGTAVLPEPTALALLALGIAGLTLRRRVA